MKLDLSDLYELKEVQQELAELKKRELSLRKDVAEQILGKLSVPGQKTIEVDNIEVVVKVTQTLKIDDPEELISMMDDETLPGIITIKPYTSLSRLKHVPDDHEIWDYMHTEVSSTPTVTIKEK